MYLNRMDGESWGRKGSLHRRDKNSEGLMEICRLCLVSFCVITKIKIYLLDHDIICQIQEHFESLYIQSCRFLHSSTVQYLTSWNVKSYVRFSLY